MSESVREFLVYLENVLLSIEKNEKYIDGLGFYTIKANEIVKDAVVRNFEIIGEAAKKNFNILMNKCPILRQNRVRLLDFEIF